MVTIHFWCFCKLTLSDSQCGSIHQEEKDVIEKTLEDWCVGMKIFSQVLAGQANSTNKKG